MGSSVGKVVGAVSSFVGGPWGQAIGMAISGYSMLQQRKQQKKAQSAFRQQAEQQRKAEETQARYSQVQAQRERLAQQRQARIRHGQILAQMGTSGLGMTGTAPLIGALGSVSSQLGRNIGDINVSEGFSQEISGYNVSAAAAGQRGIEAQSRAGGWEQVGTLAGNIFDGSFGNIYDTGNTQMKGQSSTVPLTSSNIFSGGQIGPSSLRSY